MTNGTENSRHFQIFKKKGQHSSNFDWSIETMDPRVSIKKTRGNSGTNRFNGTVNNWSLTTRARITIDIQRAFRTLKCVHGGLVEHLSKFQKRADSKKKIFLANLIRL